MYCTNCGNPINDTASVCPYCSTKQTPLIIVEDSNPNNIQTLGKNVGRIIGKGLGIGINFGLDIGKGIMDGIAKEIENNKK